jgi:RimJ/RimL family protein N-acetyltransferase
VVTLRRAVAADAEWLAELYAAEDVEPYLGAQRAKDEAAVLEEIERSEREPRRFGRMIIELDGERAGTLGWHEVNERNAIAHLEALAVHASFRRRGIAEEAARLSQRLLLGELGYHRLELACYGFNHAAIRHSERAGFIREGVKRKAYMRHGEWQDAVLFSLLREDLPLEDGSP